MVDVAGAVLTGGESRRMGRDKALLAVGGRPLAVVVADALRAAGAAPVLAVGGDVAGLTAAGLDARPDPRQGDGPLGGIATALDLLGGHEVVVVLACDLPAVHPDGIRAVVAALGDADVAVPLVDGRLEPLHAAWRPRALPAVERLRAAGERAVRAAFAVLDVVEVTGLDARWFVNLNTPGDVAGHGVGHTGGHE